MDRVGRLWVQIKVSARFSTHESPVKNLPASSMLFSQCPIPWPPMNVWDELLFVSLVVHVPDVPLKIIWMLIGPGCQKSPPATFVQEVAESAAMPRWPPAKIGPSSVWMIYRLQVTWLGQTRPLMKRSTATRWGLSFPTPASKVVKFNYQDLRHSCIDELHDNLTTFLNDWI